MLGNTFPKKKVSFSLLFSDISNNIFVIRGKPGSKLEACLLKLYFFLPSNTILKNELRIDMQRKVIIMEKKKNYGSVMKQ